MPMSRVEYDQRYKSSINQRLSEVQSLYELIFQFEKTKMDVSRELPGDLSDRSFERHIEHCSKELKERFYAEESNDEKLKIILADTLRHIYSESSAALRKVTLLNAYLNAEWPDERNTCGMPKYSVAPIIFSSIIAVCCFAPTAKNITSFINSRRYELGMLLPGANLINNEISTSTVRNIISFGEPETKRELLNKISRLQQISVRAGLTGESGFLLGHTPPDDFAKAHTYGIDGQSLNGTYKAGSVSRTIKAGDVVTMYNCSTRAPEDYAVASKKSHEKDFIEQFVQKINGKNAIVMWDSLNTTPITFKTVIDSGNHPLCPLKANRKDEYQGLKDTFSAIEDGSFNVSTMKYTSPAVTAHGRETINEFMLIPASALPEEIVSKYEGVKTAVLRRTTTRKVIRKRAVDESVKRSNERHKENLKASTETKYYLSTLEFDQHGFEQVLQSVFEYWLCEEHHHLLDKDLRQDDMTACNSDFIEGMVVIKKIASSFLKWLQEKRKLESKRSLDESISDIRIYLTASTTFAVRELGEFMSQLSHERMRDCFCCDILDDLKDEV